MEMSLPPELADASGTLQEVAGSAESRRDRNLRRIPIVVLGLIVLAGLLGFLGVRTGWSEARADGWTLRVETPEIVRPAIASPVRIVVTHDDGIHGPVHVRVGSSFFPHFDENAVVPAPSKETATPDYVEWTFDAPPAGDTLSIYIDTRLGPTEMPGPERLSFAIVDQGEVVVEVKPLMVVLP